MNKKQREQFVHSQIEHVRQGSFLKVIDNSLSMKNLLFLARSDSQWPGIASKAILAETNDQVGLYDKARQWCSPEIGDEQLNQLTLGMPVALHRRDTARAQLMLILQCAIAELRRRNNVDARQMLDRTISIFEREPSEKGDALERQHIESLFYFWRGRTFALEYVFDRAEADFQKALTVADLNLEDKLIKKVDILTDEKKKKAERHRQVAAGNYVLATVLGFGLGNTKQLEGKLHESLQSLRLAVPLSRGTEDYHRRGFAHLLLGTALRSQGEDSESTKKHLEKAIELFGESKTAPSRKSRKDRVHYLHLARATHQLALHHYDQAPYALEPSKEFEAARTLNNDADDYSRHEHCRDFYDPVLVYGITVLRSLIETGLRNFSDGITAAETATKMIDTMSLPPWISGWAWTAKGRALADSVRIPEDESKIKDAEQAFQKVCNDINARTADRAAAHFYLARLFSKVGLNLRAGVTFSHGRDLAKNLEYRWLRDLEQASDPARSVDEGYQCFFNIRDLVEEGKKTDDAWKYVSTTITDHVRDKLLVLKRDDILAKGVNTVADELGIARATLYTWLQRSPVGLEIRGELDHGKH